MHDLRRIVHADLRPLHEGRLRQPHLQEVPQMQRLLRVRSPARRNGIRTLIRLGVNLPRVGLQAVRHGNPLAGSGDPLLGHAEPAVFALSEMTGNR